MIFNYCLYGDISPTYTGDVSIELYDRTLTNVYSKIYNTDDSTYQFNLGDRDLFGINYKLYEGCSCVITIGNKYYKIKLTEDFLHEYNIDLNEVMSPSSSIASDSDNLLETIRIVTDKLILREIDQNIYSYFEVKNNSNEIVYSSNEELNWVPRETGNYNIIHRIYNSSNLEISESIININILENYIETQSIDYVYYSKRDKIIQIELPDYVLNTVILTDGFYKENNKLYGKLNNLKQVELIYSRGKIIIKPQIGDILDY